MYKSVFASTKSVAVGLLIVLGSHLCGCASGPSNNYGETMMYMPESDTNNRAPGAAYGADGMVVKKLMPTRPEWRPMEFYYKHCTQVDSRAYYSKTSYDCMGPF